MDLTEEMNVTKPFGPTIGEIQVIPEFVKNLNDYSDEIIKDKEKSKDLDAGGTLVRGLRFRPATPASFRLQLK